MGIPKALDALVGEKHFHLVMTVFHHELDSWSFLALNSAADCCTPFADLESRISYLRHSVR